MVDLFCDHFRIKVTNFCRTCGVSQSSKRSSSAMLMLSCARRVVGVRHSVETAMDAEIESLRRENEVLRSRLVQVTAAPPLSSDAECLRWEAGPHTLTSDQIGRYSRQLLLPSFGVQAQERLLSGSVLVIGAGGLGSSAALYLTAAGVGRIGVVDQDVVEINNLHRQIIHNESRVGVYKAKSAATACSQLNSSIKVDVHIGAISPQNALQLVSAYDVILDCTDNAPSRYLISDACVVAGKPLVSGAAIGTDGQLTVYNHGEDGPCYRCLFPVAPKPESCSRCSDAGVLGVIPGIIGSLQALECVKILAEVGQVASRKLVIFDGLAMRFHTVKLRARMKDCMACGPDATITAESLPAYSYTDFTGQAANDSAPAQLHLLPADQRVSPQALADRLRGSSAPLVIDVRPCREFELAHLTGSVNFPFTDNLLDVSHMVKLCQQHTSEPLQPDEYTPNAGSPASEQATSRVPDHSTKPASADALSTKTPASGPNTPAGVSELAIQGSSGTCETTEGYKKEIIVVCRRGNDSQHVVQLLRGVGVLSAVDLIGGLSAWSQQLDPSFPDY